MLPCGSSCLAWRWPEQAWFSSCSDGGLHAASAAASAVSKRLDRIASAHGAASRRLFGRRRNRKGPAATGGVFLQHFTESCIFSTRQLCCNSPPEPAMYAEPPFSGLLCCEAMHCALLQLRCCLAKQRTWPQLLWCTRALQQLRQPIISQRPPSRYPACSVPQMAPTVWHHRSLYNVAHGVFIKLRSDCRRCRWRDLSQDRHPWSKA
jgi:hypothetical protein